MTENPLGEVQSRNRPETHCHILEQKIDNPVQLPCFREETEAGALVCQGPQSLGRGPSAPGLLPRATQPLVRAWGGGSHVPLASQPGEDTYPLRNV